MNNAIKNILSSLGGFSKSNLDNTTTDTQINIIGIIITMIIAAGFSAILVGRAMSQFCFEGQHFWVIFCIWLPIVFLMDRTMLRPNNSKLSYVFRLLIAIGISIITSFSLETDIFDQVAKEYYRQQTKDENRAVDTYYHGQIAPLQDQRIRLLTTIDSIEDIKSARMEEINDEILDGNGLRASGKGKVAIELEGRFNKDTITWNTRINDLQAYVNGLDESILALNNEKSSEIESNNKKDSYDLIETTAAIHKYVFGPTASISEKILYLAVHLVILGFELIVIILKTSYNQNLEEYRKAGKKEEDLINQRLAFEFNEKEAQLRHESALKMAELKKNENNLNASLKVNDLDIALKVMKQKAEKRLQSLQAINEYLQKYTTEILQNDDFIKEQLPEFYDELKQEFIDAEIAKLKNDLKTLSLTI